MKIKSQIKRRLLYVLKRNIQNSISINVTIPGTFFTLLTDHQKNAVTNLTIKGSIDARDVKHIRDFMPRLSNLDMKAATIKAYYGNKGTCDFSILYPANEIPQNSFYDCYTGTSNTVLTSVILPSSVTRIGYSAFLNCLSLSNLTLPVSLIYFDSLAVLGCVKLSTHQINNKLTLDGEPVSIDNTGAFTVFSDEKTTSKLNLQTA